MVMRAVKASTTTSEQIDLLKSRGMELEDGTARQWLISVGYYRLSGYWYPYRQFPSDTDSSRGDDFEPKTSFDEVVELYEFDRKLRTLIHDGIERIEVALRAQVSSEIAGIGPLAYEDSTNFRPGFDHDRWLATARRRVARAHSHSDPVRHYQAEYGGHLPIWVLTEVLDFADVSMLYEGLPALSQRRIAESLGVSVDLSPLGRNQRAKVRRSHPLVRWFEHLTIIRNTAAHHSRLWNRSFAPVPTPALRTIPALVSLPEGQSERAYGALLVMGHLLQTISPGTTWCQKVRGLVEDSFELLALRSVGEMGFPEDWQQRSPWNMQ